MSKLIRVDDETARLIEQLMEEKQITHYSDAVRMLVHQAIDTGKTTVEGQTDPDQPILTLTYDQIEKEISLLVRAPKGYKLLTSLFIKQSKGARAALARVKDEKLRERIERVVYGQQRGVHRLSEPDVRDMVRSAVAEIDAKKREIGLLADEEG